MVDRVLIFLGMKRDPKLKAALATSEEINRRVNEKLDRMELADAIREQARKDERRLRERM